MKSPLHATRAAVLDAVIALGDEAYGMEIFRTVCQTTERPFHYPSIYQVIEKLLARGLLKIDSVGEPLPERGGKARTIFKVTESGLEALNFTKAYWKARSRPKAPVKTLRPVKQG